jgi:hypothetical protein
MLREDILRPATGIGSLWGTGNNTSNRLVNYSASNSLIDKNTLFSHHSIHKYIWTSVNGKICPMSNVLVNLMKNIKNYQIEGSSL